MKSTRSTGTRSFEKEKDPMKPMVPARSESFSFVDDGLSKRILLGFHKQWIKGQFLDVTITLDGEHIRAHKCVLSSFSQYFEALFSSNMSDADLDVIPLHGISENAVKLLINFAYSGSVEITGENVQDLLFASNYLCVDSVIGSCCEYLVRNLSVENCIDIHELGGTLGQIKMTNEAESFMGSHFRQLLEEDRFLRLSPETLRTLLETDQLVVMNKNVLISADHEEKVLVNAVLHYVGEKPEDRLEHLTLLLSHGVRLLLIQTETIESLKSHALVARSPECLNLLNRILSSKISKEERERWEHPRFFKVEYEGTKEVANDGYIHAPTELFDDSSMFREGERFFIVGMKLHTRRWHSYQVIAAIEVFYNTGLSMTHGSKHPATRVRDEEFRIGQNEYITELKVQAGGMLDQLEVKTNEGKVYGPYGGGGGDHFKFVCPCEGAYLAYVTGKVVDTEGAASVRNIRFFWGVPKSLAA